MLLTPAFHMKFQANPRRCFEVLEKCFLLEVNISVPYSVPFSSLFILYLATQEGTLLWLKNHNVKWRIYWYGVYSGTNPNFDMSNVLFLVFCNENLFFIILFVAIFSNMQS